MLIEARGTTYIHIYVYTLSLRFPPSRQRQSGELACGRDALADSFLSRRARRSFSPAAAAAGGDLLFIPFLMLRWIRDSRAGFSLSLFLRAGARLVVVNLRASRVSG